MNSLQPKPSKIYGYHYLAKYLKTCMYHTMHFLYIYIIANRKTQPCKQYLSPSVCEKGLSIVQMYDVFAYQRI